MSSASGSSLISRLVSRFTKRACAASPDECGPQAAFHAQRNDPTFVEEPEANEPQVQDPKPASSDSNVIDLAALPSYLMSSQASGLLELNSHSGQRQTAPSDSSGAILDVWTAGATMTVDMAMACIEELGVRRVLDSLVPMSTRLQAAGFVFVARDEIRKEAFERFGYGLLIGDLPHMIAAQNGPKIIDAVALEALVNDMHGVARSSFLGRLRACGLMLYVYPKAQNALEMIECNPKAGETAIIAGIFNSYNNLTNRLMKRVSC